jgi:hypothetical protein
VAAKRLKNAIKSRTKKERNQEERPPRSNMMGCVADTTPWKSSIELLSKVGKGGVDRLVSIGNDQLNHLIVPRERLKMASRTRRDSIRSGFSHVSSTIRSGNNQPLLNLLCVKMMRFAIDDATVILAGFWKAIFVGTFPRSLSGTLHIAGCTKLGQVVSNPCVIFGFGTLLMMVWASSVETRQTARGSATASRGGGVDYQQQ